MYEADGHKRTYTLHIKVNETAINLINNSISNNEGIIPLYTGNHYNKDEIFVSLLYIRV